MHVIRAVWENVECYRGRHEVELGPGVHALTARREDDEDRSNAQGKSLPLSARVLTPTGWRPMGELKVDDYVCRPGGGLARILGVYPQGGLPTFRITTKRGLSARSSADHLWLVKHERHGRSDNWELRTLSELGDGKGWQLPPCRLVDFFPLWVPIDPYVLGVLLGDGHLTKGGASVTTADDQFAAALEAFAAAFGLRVSVQNRRGKVRELRLVGRKGAANPLVSALEVLGLRNLRSHEKFIPDCYKYNSREVRLAVLRGLMDTDGSVTELGCADYISCSKRLADDLAEVIRSLGGMAVVRRKRTAGRTAFRIHPSLPEPMFVLGRKASRTRSVPPGALGIAQIEPDGFEACQCIKLDSEDGLFVTDDHLVTHNTTLLKILGPLPLYGWHGRPREDDWINDASKEAMVELHLDEGAVFRRWRKRGSSTKAEVVDGAGARKALEETVAELVGNKDDFFSTAFFKQKAIARLLEEDPAERMRLVSSWLDLGELQACEDAARRRASAARAHADGIKERVVRAEEALKTAEEQLRTLPSAEEIDRDLQTACGRLTALREQRAKRREWLDAKRRAEDYAELVRDGKQLNKALEVERAALPAAPDAALLSAAREKASKAALDYASVASAAAGKFDGKCPVTCRECPVAGQINADRAQHAKKAEALAKKHEKAKADRGELEEQEQEHRLAEQDLKRKEGKLQRMREEARKLRGPDPGPEVPDVEDEVYEVERNIAVLGASRTTRRQAEAVRKRMQLALTEAQGELKAARAAERRAGESVVIFGRNGAQRRHAEANLAEIEEGANELLAESGTRGTVSVSWAREGRGLAVHCEHCGEAFPASQKVKECGRCGAERGPKLVERMDVNVQPLSDGYEDLAGLALQLSAAAWLRAARSIAWSVAYVDEPFGALDAANRTGVAAHLAAMLSGRYGFRQSFVVAHNREISEALPKRIEVVGSDRGSRVEVR